MTWFGTFEVPIEASRFWHVGPLRLWLKRRALEWQATRERGDDPLEDSLSIAEEPTSDPTDDADTTRFGFRAAPSTVTILPRPASRPVVVKTAKPFVLPPKEEATLFLSTPLWLQIQLSEATVLDEPIFRPSDTWFGPNTQIGELCYGSKTTARLELANLPLRPHRALTAVRIRNRAKSKVEIEHLLFPMPNLSLFANESGVLWTESLTFDRRKDDDDANIQLGKTPPVEAGEVRRVVEARERAQKSFLMRTFGGLLDLGREP